MSKISKLGIVAAAICAIVLIGAVGAYAYWSVVQPVTGNSISSGHLSMAVVDGVGSQTVAAPITLTGIMPGEPVRKKTYEIKSPAGNPNTDFGLTFGDVAGEGTLKDNLKIAIMLGSDANYAYWLTPAGAVDYGTLADPNNNPDTNPAVLETRGFALSEYSLKSWTASPSVDKPAGLPGYRGMPALTVRHINVYYWLPADCSEDCHDSDVNFDMTFSLLQSHS